MKWELFWTAFGAIGTTIGSIATAIAVGVAVMQYKQPVRKKIKLDFSKVYIWDEETWAYRIGIQNRYLTEVEITGVYIEGKRENLWLTAIYKESGLDIHPHIFLKPGKEESLMFDTVFMENELRKAVDRKILNTSKKIVVCAMDLQGEIYRNKSKLRVQDIISENS